ncbi:Lrp/AsnC family transcriptional regulator [Pseudomonas aeruginosa]|nr:Lrp/AsnC family transcriptional regulator [Pseudomonas aeruginosa]
MDKYDRALLAALIDNGRLTFAELARRINLSPPAVADRVAKLEAEGVITGYHASVNLAKLGLPIECVIELRITAKDCQSVLDELARIPQLTLCHRITGDACVLMKAAVASMPELQDLIDRLMKFGISKTSMILSTPFADRQPASLRGQDGNGGCAA